MKSLVFVSPWVRITMRLNKSPQGKSMISLQNKTCQKPWTMKFLLFGACVRERMEGATGQRTLHSFRFEKHTSRRKTPALLAGEEATCRAGEGHCGAGHCNKIGVGRAYAHTQMRRMHHQIFQVPKMEVRKLYIRLMQGKTHPQNSLIRFSTSVLGI